MTVADRFLRNRKITRTTSASVSQRVNLTSETEARMDSDLSKRIVSRADPGSEVLNWGRSLLMLETTSTVFSPGCFWIARTMLRLGPVASTYHDAVLLFSTPSTA